LGKGCAGKDYSFQATRNATTMSDNKEPKTANKLKTLEEVKNELNERLHTIYDPDAVLREAQEKIEKPKLLSNEDDDGPDEEDNQLTEKDPLFKAMTLSEFHNGALMVSGVPEQYRTFGIDMFRKIQEEYSCITISEKAIAELATINYIRTLEIQRRITAYLDMNSLTDNGVKYLAIISKELDRANRHFLTAIQTLRMIKQPSFNVNIKTNTAIVGQNQLIQENQNVKPI